MKIRMLLKASKRLHRVLTKPWKESARQPKSTLETRHRKRNNMAEAMMNDFTDVSPEGQETSMPKGMS